MNPHTDKQLETAFRVAYEANPKCFEDAYTIKLLWRRDKREGRNSLSCEISTNVVRALLYMMGSNPDVHVDDIKWYAFLATGDVVRMKNADETFPGIVAVKKVVKGDKE